MKRAIALSDTHGLLWPEVLEYLSQADIIIHGGDISTQAIVDKLRECAPLYIVRGNNDKEWAEGLPRKAPAATTAGGRWKQTAWAASESTCVSAPVSMAGSGLLFCDQREIRDVHRFDPLILFVCLLG